jgi:hypothetical protein
MEQMNLKPTRPQLLTYFVTQKNQRGEFLLSPRAYKTRELAQAYIQNVLGGHGTVVLAAGVVEITPVLTEVLP